MRSLRIKLGASILGIVGSISVHGAMDVVVATGYKLPMSNYTLRGGTLVADTGWTITAAPAGEKYGASVNPIVESPKDYWAPQTIPDTHFIKPPPRSPSDNFDNQLDNLNHQVGSYRYEYNFSLAGAPQWGLSLNAFADDKAKIYIDNVSLDHLLFTTTPWDVALKDVAYSAAAASLGENVGPEIGSKTDARFYTKITDPNLLKLLVAGDHTLIVVVDNAGYNPPYWGQTGVDLLARFTPVPEPSTWFAGAFAFGLMGYLGWKNRIQASLK